MDELGWDQIAHKMEKLADFLEEVDKAVKTTDPSPRTIDVIAEKLEINLDNQIQPLEPLHETHEQAQLEQELKAKTKSIMLGTAIEKKIKEILS